MNKHRNVVAVALACALVVTACSRNDSTDSLPPLGSDLSQPTDPIVVIDGEERGDDPELEIRLGEGTAPDSPEAPDVEAAIVTDGVPLDEAETSAVLDALPELEPAPATTAPATTTPPTTPPPSTAPPSTAPPPDGETTTTTTTTTEPAGPTTTVVAVPPLTNGPPTPGNQVQGVFPPASDADSPTVPSSEPLEVVRFQPEGDVDIAPYLTVTFNQPMVALATLETLEATEIPVELSPDIEGRWRWIGTRTLRFEVDPDSGIDRLPAATRFEATIAAGTTAVSGAALDDEVSWSFRTPTANVTLVSGAATTGASRPPTVSTEPIFVIEFDQLIDADEVLDATTLSADGSATPIRLATDDEINADDTARAAWVAATAGRAVAVRPVDPLPTDTPLVLAVGPDIPSAEGPLLNPDAAEFTARTYGPLEIVESDCTDARCAAGTGFSITFNNELETNSLSASDLAALISIDPPLAGARIAVSGSVVNISGQTTARTTYDIGFDGELRDVFGQPLADAETVSFEVADANPLFRGPDRDMVIVDPGADRAGITVTSINHTELAVTVWGVSPTEFSTFGEFRNEFWGQSRPEAPDWQLLRDETISTDAASNEIARTFIDLSGEFAQVGSQLVVLVEPVTAFGQNDDLYWNNRPSVTWVQNTTLALDAFVDGSQLLVWTTDLVTGEPVPKVPVELMGDDRVVTTDDHGVASIELTDAPVSGLYANAGDRVAFLPSWYEPGWVARDASPESRWYVFDDQGIYRPGETARITGWVRTVDPDTGGLALPESETITWMATDALGNDLGSGEITPNPLGGFNLSVDVPVSAGLGEAFVEFSAGDNLFGYHHFQVQQFRQPQFEVDTRTVSTTPHLSGQPSTVAVEASYYSGGPLPDAQVNWVVSTADASYSPPGWDDYVFGAHTPWWYECFECGPGTNVTYQEFSGRTDGAGAHYLELGFGDDTELPSAVTAEATVFDVNRQAWSSSTNLLVHPAKNYVGIKSDRSFVELGEPLSVDTIVTDIDGDATSGRAVSVEIGRVDGRYEAGQWVEEVVDTVECSFDSVLPGDNDADAMTCEATPEIGGRYLVTAIVTDADGRTSRTERTLWVSGGIGTPGTSIDLESVTIVPDRDAYEPGDTAELLVVTPWPHAHGLVTVSQGSLQSYETFEAETGTTVIELEIEEGFVPEVSISVEAAAATDRTDSDGEPIEGAPPRPAYATGNLALSVPPVTKSLTVEPTVADAEIEPGADTSVTVAVTDNNGDPVSGAQVAVVVVDEAVLALTAYDLDDPLDIFYRPVRGYLEAVYSRAAVQLAAPSSLSDGGVDDSVEESEAADDGASDTAVPGAAPDSSSRSEVRTNFNPVAVFAPDAETDDDGIVTIDFTAPDNLTRYRLMAVAVDDVDRFGIGESTLTARLPLQVQPSAPRLLRLGDTFEFPVVVQNQTDAPIEVDVAIEATRIEFTEGAGRKITVPANNRVEVRFPARVTEVGNAKFQVGVRSTVDGQTLSDAAAGGLPIYTPATTEAFATYGTLDAANEAVAIGQPLRPPTDVFESLGGLEVSVSSTALQSLTDAAIYLTEYDYESAEASAARLVAIATLVDVVGALASDTLPDADELAAIARDDIGLIVDLQNDDGGWSHWTRGRPSVPWLSLEVAHALVIAERGGFAVPSATINAALEYVNNLDAHLTDSVDGADRIYLLASAVAVLRDAGRADDASTAASKIYLETSGEVGVEVLALLWPSINDDNVTADIERRITNAAQETAGAVTYATEYADSELVTAASSHRSDAVILRSLMSETPDSDLIAKTVQGLLAGQVDGRWSNVFDNAAVLVALHAYFVKYELVDPAFTARAWLGDTVAVDHEFTEREALSTTVPMPEVIAALADAGSGTTDGDAEAADPGLVDLIVENIGTGRLYYRLGLNYAPTDLSLEARDEGFIVERIYEPIDDPNDVIRNADGSWNIKAGAAVRVRVTMVAESRRTHVALVDPLPAGLEPVNPSLAVSQTLPPDDGSADAVGTWRGWDWFEHQGLRDDRAEAFTSVLPGGTYEYTYVARATTPGTFVAPPARAEEMYAPEVFGRSGTDRVIVS